MAFVTSFILLLFSGLCYSNLSWSFEPLNPEVLALIDVKSNLIDPYGALNNWDEDSVDPCSWAMITCSPQNLVLGLGAPGQNLSGTLSPSIGNLTNLQQVLLQNNNLSGKLPDELAKLPKLQTLDLSNNSFTGSVPVSISQLPNLQYFDLSYNNLSGIVPKFPAKTFNVAGNPMICGRSSANECSGANTAAPPSFRLDSLPRTEKSRAQKVACIIGATLGSASFLPLLGLPLWWKKKQKHQMISDMNESIEEGITMVKIGNLRQFGLRELQTATDSFNPKNILGKGGFGNVYRGKLVDGTLVAVKRLSETTASGESQFRTEVEMISLAVHRNLLRLIGYCAAGNERLLVYPFMANGSVASRLRGKPALDWQTRKRIAVGAARGLLYLHEQCDPKIIHRDVKAANILLDDVCETVVGDFGLAKLLDHSDSHVTTAVRGTVGHIAPECLSTGQSSEKTDVFGFGILLLELVTGLRALDFGKSACQKGATLDWLKKAQQEKQLEVVVDKEMRGEYDRIEVGEMVQVALLCTQFLPSHRSKMSDVVKMLEGDGLAEKWEASQKNNECQKPWQDDGHQHHQQCGDDDDHRVLILNGDREDDLHYLQNMELSGPR